MKDERSEEVGKPRWTPWQSTPHLATHHRQRSNESDVEDLLSLTIKDAVYHSFGVVFVEVWVISSDGQRISRPPGGHWMDPVFIHSVPNPGIAREVNTWALDCAPGESLAGTLFAETSRVWNTNRKQIRWRQIKSMMDDPFVEQGRDKRMEQLYGQLGIGIVATIPFRFQHRNGIVMFMSRTSVDVDKLKSDENEKYLLGAADLIGASFAIREARDECSRLKKIRRRAIVENLKASSCRDSSGKSRLLKAILIASRVRVDSREPSLLSSRIILEDGEEELEQPEGQSAVSKSQTRLQPRSRVLAFATMLSRQLKNSVLKWRGARLKAPPRQDLGETLIAGVGIFCTMLALSHFADNFPDEMFTEGWYPSTLAIVFSLTAAPVGQPVHIVCSHIWNSLVGLAFRRTGLPANVKHSMSTAFGVTGMAYLGIMHPPASSLAFIFASQFDARSLLWIFIGGEFERDEQR
jgi:hypothetical protein